MPPFGPIKRRDLIRALRQFGFDGPFSGGNHQYMVKAQLKLSIPNPHQGDPTFRRLAVESEVFLILQTVFSLIMFVFFMVPHS